MLKIKNMEAQGIFIENNAKGVPTFARIDLRKYGSELKDFFSSKGIVIEKSPYDPEFVAKIRQSEQQIKEGNFHRLDLDNLWK
jgi:hypothetical protein